MVREIRLRPIGAAWLGGRVYRGAGVNIPGAPLDDAVFEAFSHPGPVHDRELDAWVPLAVEHYSAELVGAFCDRFRARIQDSGSDLLEYLEASLCTADTLSMAGWDCSIGNLARLASRPHADHPAHAVAVALQLGSCGLAGSWSAVWQSPHRLRWGPWVLPQSQSIRFDSSGTAARIECGGVSQGSLRSIRFALGPVTWSAADGARRVPAFRGERGDCLLLDRQALDLADFEEIQDRVEDSVPPSVLSNLRHAMGLVSIYAPEYVGWIARAVHQIFLVKSPPQRVESGSFEHYLGTIHMSMDADPLHIAELLVHEASHQYLNIVRKIAPIDDGSDEVLYWSPPVKRHRPIGKILTAYHAFGNVLRFYRLLLERGYANREECNRQEARMAGWLTVLSEPLSRTPALTSAGRGLYRPLHQDLSIP